MPVATQYGNLEIVLLVPSNTYHLRVGLLVVQLQADYSSYF